MTPPLSTLYRLLAGLPHRLRGARLADRWVSSPPTEVAPAPTAESAAWNPVREQFESHAGRGVQKWLHYFEVYHRHLGKFVGRHPVVVEIGVFSGGSLAMWHGYFGPGCHVHGIDIDPGCESFADERTTIHIGDQADRALWARFREEVPRVDIMIDDGGHTAEQQGVTLEEMLAHLRPGGVYICEDVHRSGNRFAELACSLVHALNEGSITPGAAGDSCERTPFQAGIHSLHFYPFLLVIEKHERAPPAFSAPLRGSDWRVSPWA